MRSCSLNLKIPACLAIFLAVYGLSCKPKSPKETDADKPATTPAGSVTENVAVTIDGVDILESEIEKLVKPQLEMLAKKSSQLPPEVTEQYARQFREQFLEQTIRRYLLDKKVKEANIAITDEEVMSMINEIASSQKEPLSLEEFKKKMAEYGQSFDEIKDEIRSGLARNKFMEAKWAGKINVTEDDARKYYDENTRQFEMPEQVRVSHILIKPVLADPNADPNEAKAKTRARTEGLLKQIKDGADFAELAKANSACPSAPKGGDLGFFPRGETTPAFEKAAFETEIGQISDIVETKYGYHIIKVTDHKDASTASFDQAKDNIVQQLTEKKKSDIAEEYIESLKAQANIVYPTVREPASGANTNNP